MMRVLFWSELFWPHIGGAEIFGAKLLLALRERGYEIIVVTRQDSPDLPSEDKYKGIPVYRFPFYTALASRSVDEFVMARQGVARLRRAFAPDLVHLHGFGSSLLFYLETNHVHRAPLLVTLINERHEKEEHHLLSRVLRTADWVTGKSTAVLVEAHRFVPDIRNRSSLIYNGLDVPALSPAPLPTAPPRLLCLGRLVTQKGFDLAIATLSLIRNRFPDAGLIIAGDGPERPALERTVAEKGLRNAVDFIGWVRPDHVFALINTSTIVVIPSRWEGLPSVVLQAAMMARPVVATRVSGLSEVVVHQRTGLLVEPEDVEALAAAIASLLGEPEGAIRMGEAARQRVQRLFGWEECVGAYDNFWRRLIMERRRQNQTASQMSAQTTIE